MRIRHAFLIVIALALGGGSARAADRGQVSWKKGMSFYRAYEFEKAIPWFVKSIQHPPKRWNQQHKSYARVVLSLCYYNLADTQKAFAMFRNALSFDREVKLPPLVPVHVKARYEAHRREWKKKNAKTKSVFQFPKSRLQNEKKTKQRWALKKRILLPPPKPPFRYTGGLLLLGGAALLGGGALGLLLGSKHAYAQATEIHRRSEDSAMRTKRTYEQSYVLGLSSIIASIVAGGLAGAGGAWIIYQASRPPLRQAPLQTPTTKDNTK